MWQWWWGDVISQNLSAEAGRGCFLKKEDCVCVSVCACAFVSVRESICTNVSIKANIQVKKKPYTPPPTTQPNTKKCKNLHPKTRTHSDVGLTWMSKFSCICAKTSVAHVFIGMAPSHKSCACRDWRSAFCTDSMSLKHSNSFLGGKKMKKNTICSS